ncbi:MAG: carboxypeptidase regulatory-like domain-containing protein, partial [Bacteroidia bacterium]|nr:carboxypeptidase regulatory-like domain-containing protein [Bacteroidia bacterium]
MPSHVPVLSKSFSIRPFKVICFLFFLFSVPAYAQNTATISGTITDSTGKALPDANISLFGLPTGTS